MTKSEARKLVHKHLMPLMRGIGVSAWTIQIYYGKIDSDNCPAGFSNQMECAIHYSYEKAEITINNEVIPDEAELVAGLRHELIHIALAPINAFNTHVRKHVGEQPGGTWEAIDNAWHEHLERAVLNVERMLEWGLGQTPMKLSAAMRRRWDPPKKKRKRR